MLEEEITKEIVLDTYILLGKYDVEKFIGGEIKTYETPLEDRFRVEGMLDYEGTTHQVKGIATHETMDNIIFTSILLFEYPIKNDNSNIIYNFDRTFRKKHTQLDSEKYGRIPTPKTAWLEGPYIGNIHKNATIKTLDKELLADFKDVPLAEFIFPEIDFDENNSESITLELTKD